MSPLPKFRLVREIDSRLRGVYCKITGDIDSVNTPQIEKSLRDWMARHGGTTVIDIRESRYVESSGIKMFCRLLLEARKRKARFVLITNRLQDRLLKIFKLDRAFLTAKSREEAAEILQEPKALPLKLVAGGISPGAETNSIS